MGLFDVIKNVGELAGDVAQLDDVLEQIGKVLESAHKAGKVDDKVWNAFKAVDSADLAEKLKAAQKFADILDEHKDKLPAELKEKAEKLTDVIGLLGKAQNLLGK